jgi:hypothetical protein
VYRFSIILFSLGLLAGCGGAGTSASAPPTNLGGGAVAKPVTVTVNAGQTAGDVNIAVVAPASSPPPNATVLGVAALTGSGSAFNTGATIPRGATQRVLLFGPGLSGSMQVKITGPADITISNIITIKATDGTAGVSFTAAVAGNAALGCRTVVLQASNGDITTFTGGLEVVP